MNNNDRALNYHYDSNSNIRVISALLFGFIIGFHSYTQVLSYNFGYYGVELGQPIFNLTQKLQYILWLSGALFFVSGFYILIKYSQLKLKKFAYALLIISTIIITSSFYSPYSLFDGLKWTYLMISNYSESYNSILFYGAVTLIPFFQIGSFLGFMLAKLPPKEANTHGSARESAGDELLDKIKKHQPTDYFVLGRHGITNELLTYKRDSHLITCAPTRSGKGIGTVIPNLLLYKGNIIQTDPKGENIDITFKHRRDFLGHKIIALDPFKVSSYSSSELMNGKEDDYTDAINPLDVIPEDDVNEIYDLSKDIASGLVDREGEKDPFWNNKGEELIRGFISYVAVKFKKDEVMTAYGKTFNPRSIYYIYKLINTGAEDLKLYCDAIVKDPEVPHDFKDFATKFRDMPEKQREGIVGTASDALDNFGNAKIQDATSRTSFNLDSILNDKVTIYIVLPSEKSKNYKTFMRIMVQSLLNFILKNVTSGAQDFENRILFSLDEFANMGRLDAIKKGISYVAGFGITFWIYLQDINQLKMYGDDKDTIFSNAEVYQFFGAKDKETLQLISDLSGETSVFQKNITTGSSTSSGKGMVGSGSSGRSTSESTSETKRQLYTLGEIRTMSNDDQLIFYSNSSIIRCKKIRFFNDDHFTYQNGKPMYLLKEHYLNLVQARKKQQAKLKALKKKRTDFINSKEVNSEFNSDIIA
jgi:type IV secretion system protein VirD4